MVQMDADIWGNFQGQETSSAPIYRPSVILVKPQRILKDNTHQDYLSKIDVASVVLGNNHKRDTPLLHPLSKFVQKESSTHTVYIFNYNKQSTVLEVTTTLL